MREAGQAQGRGGGGGAGGEGGAGGGEGGGGGGGGGGMHATTARNNGYLRYVDGARYSLYRLY